MALRAADRQAVRNRASGRCEYCHMEEAWEPFYSYHLEHIIARQHGGPDDLDNLAYACHHCNLLKGPNLTSLDPDTGALTELFHPRLDRWTKHFRIHTEKIVGLTAKGRATVFLMKMNVAHRSELRKINAP